MTDELLQVLLELTVLLLHPGRLRVNFADAYAFFDTTYSKCQILYFSNCYSKDSKHSKLRYMNIT